MAAAKKCPHTLSNYDELRVTHMALDITLDFARKVVVGSATYTAEAQTDNVATLKLDTSGITVSGATQGGASIAHAYGADTPPFGRALELTLAAPVAKAGDTVDVTVQFETSPDASALQWLEPSQTAGKKHPYLFSQCQAIHARTFVPVQDTPAAKVTYTAAVHAPEPLVVLMSALSDDAAHTDAERAADAGGNRTFFFKQAVPIATYLLAVACGELEARAIGPRSHVWSEPSMVEAAAYEFAETERFLAAGEALLGAYAWGKYDLLILPPSFPYGGMENPSITYATPTLIAGDRSNAGVVAHEIAHSWTGNLVTNSTWEHFWLNEGFTVFVERKILAAVRGADYFDFSATIGWKALTDSIAHIGVDGEFTKLVQNQAGVDPDDAFSSVPYEKGFNFLYFLERTLGGPAAWEPFLHMYINKYAFKTVTTDDFKREVIAHFSALGGHEAGLAAIDWDAWLHGTGLPPVLPSFSTKLSQPAIDLAAAWARDATAPALADKATTQGWNAGQTCIFLNKLAAAGLDAAATQRLDDVHGFSASKNFEILFRYLDIALRASNAAVYDKAVAMLLAQGRMKFTRPLYRALFNADGGRELAVATFTANRGIYHPVCAKMVASDLGL